MSLIYDLAELSHSGLALMQTAQRDWSPYLVHFTSSVAMKAVRAVVDKTNPFSAADINKQLKASDEYSFDVFSKIVSSGTIQQSKRYHHVCLSECSLPGLLGHSERFGRFGFMFEKSTIHKLGGRPCAYLDKRVCDEIRRIGRTEANLNLLKLGKRINTYRPTFSRERLNDQSHVQDYTVEREWRVLGIDIPINDACGLICPQAYFAKVFEAMEKFWDKNRIPVFPLDMLYKWGV